MPLAEGLGTWTLPTKSLPGVNPGRAGNFSLLFYYFDVSYLCAEFMDSLVVIAAADESCFFYVVVPGAFCYSLGHVEVSTGVEAAHHCSGDSCSG